MSIDTLQSNDPAAIAAAMRVLAEGGIVAYPTETFYGLGVMYNNADALGRLAILKGRVAEKAFPLIVGDVETLELVAASVGSKARALITEHWPGALTILLHAKPGLPARICAHSRVAVRMPGASFALLLASAIGVPITSTSANPSLMHPPATAAEVERYFPFGIDLLIDGGTTPGGTPSTIVDVTGPETVIIRRGSVTLGG